MVCGRCGHRTASNSSYCPHDRWMLFVDVPEGDRSAGDAIARLEAPRGVGGMFERRRLDKQCQHMGREISSALETRLEIREHQIEADPDNFEAQREMGLMSMIDGHWERANAHFERAHSLNNNDFETHVNYAITLAHRGQLQPALDLLQHARVTWPRTPAVLFNLALVGLQARRSTIVLDAIGELEGMWSTNDSIAQDYHDEALTLRGLALLEDGKFAEARNTLEQAARHQVASGGAKKMRLNLETGQMEAVEEESGGIEHVDVPADAEDEDDQAAAPQDDFLQLEGKANDADLLNNLGIAEAAAGDFHKAVARLGAAMRLEPGNARVHNNLGVLAYGQNQLPVAYQHLELARQIEEFIEQPEPATFNHLGVVLSAMGRSEDSLNEFQKAGGHERAEFEVWYNLGRAYIEFGKPDKGVEYLRRAYQLNPNHPDVHVVLGAAYLLRGQTNLLPEAMKHFKRALQINATHRTAFSNMAMAFMEMGQFEPALKIAQEDLRHHPRSADGLFILALLLLRAAHGDEADQTIARAATLFNKAFELRPDLLVCLYNMALCQYVVGLRDAAAAQLEAVVRRDPSLAPAYYLIGVGHADGKRYAEALAAWQKALQFEPGNPDLQANMAYIYYQRGDWEKAISCYFKAHMAAPQEPYFLSAMGLAYARLGQLKKSIDCFQHSLRLQPNDPVTHSNLGLAYYIKNDVEQAVSQWRVVSRLDAAYASRREEETERKQYDESGITLRPLNWRSRVIRMAPVLARPHTHLVAGYNARNFRFAITDPQLQHLKQMKDELTSHRRLLGWMYARS